MSTHHKNPGRTFHRTMRVLEAWEYLAPGDSFAGMTLEQFRQNIAASIEVRQQIKSLQQQLRSLSVQRSLADTESHELTSYVVSSVLGSPDHGSNSPLYHAMGYITASRRASGLVRKSRKDPPDCGSKRPAC